MKIMDELAKLLPDYIRDNGRLSNYDPNNMVWLEVNIVDKISVRSKAKGQNSKTQSFSLADPDCIQKAAEYAVKRESDYEMRDKEFLQWIHDRLEHVHGENKNVDFMHKLRSIIKVMPADQLTPNTE